MSSRYDRAAAARANPRPTREEVLAEVIRTFPDEDAAAVMDVLDEYGLESYERERERAQRAILMLAEGDVDKLLEYTQAAKHDYRDVLLWAEYPERVEAFQKAFNAEYPGGVQEFIERLRRPRDP